MLEPGVSEQLGLEPGQIKTLKKGIQKMQKQEENLREKLQAAAKAQAELLQAKDEIDEEALMKAIEKTGKIRTQMAKLRMQPVLLVRKTLTDEQLQTSRKIMHERMQRRREEWHAQQRRGDHPRRRDEDEDQRRKRKKDKGGKKKDKATEAESEE
jgi:hypothetical protein